MRIALAAAGNPLFAEELVAWARDGGDVDALPTTLNALLGARLDRLRGRGARRPRARRGRGRALPPRRRRRALRRERAARRRRRARRADAQGPDSPDGRDASRARSSPTASSTSSCARRPTARRRRSSAPRCTSATRTGSSGASGARVGEYEEVLGYHLEQAYLLRGELGPLDADATALAARAAGISAPAAGAPVPAATTAPPRTCSSARLRLVPPETVEGAGAPAAATARRSTASAAARGESPGPRADRGRRRARRDGACRTRAGQPRRRPHLRRPEPRSRGGPRDRRDRPGRPHRASATRAAIAEHERNLGLICRLEGGNAEGSGVARARDRPREPNATIR